jgi:hypothetical protein
MCPIRRLRLVVLVLLSMVLVVVVLLVDRRLNDMVHRWVVVVLIR